MAGADQIANEIETAGNFGRERDDADAGAVRRDRLQDLVTGEVAFGPLALRLVRAQAVHRLRAVPFGVDEVAFEMRGQHAGGAGAGADARARDRRRAASSAVAGVHATDVGQNAVTPYFGSRRATSATASAPSSTSMPSMPWTCTSTKPGTMT